MVDVAAEVPRIVGLHVLAVLAEERTVLRRAEPRVPVQRLARRAVAVRMALHPVADRLALRPHRTVRPDVHLGDIADDAALQDLRAAAHGVERAALVAHLHDDAVVLRRLVEVLELPQGADERLLHVDVDALLHRADRDRTVNVVGRRDRHRLDAKHAGIVHELAVVGVERNLRDVNAEGLEVLSRRNDAKNVSIRIADRHEFGHTRLQHRHPVRIALAERADAREADLALALADREAATGRQHRRARETAEERPSVQIHVLSPSW